MINHNKRFSSFLKILVNSDKPLPSNVICNQLNISSRTLRVDINNYKSVFIENGMELISCPGVGYSMEIIDENKYFNFIHDMLRKEASSQCVIPVDPIDRINYIIKEYLSTDDYLKLDDVAEKLYISKSTISNDIREVRKAFSYFHLQLESIPGEGMRVIGDEFHKRSCIAQYFFHTETIDELFMKKEVADKNQEQIRNLLYETMNQCGFRLSDIGFRNLIIHLSIVLMRIDENDNQIMPKQYEELEGYIEYQNAQVIAKKMEEIFTIKLPKIEIYYITIHLLGKKAEVYSNNFVISKEIEKILEKIFDEIARYYDYDFSADFELYTLLALHFQPMMNRLRFGMTIQNPLLEQIKKDQLLAFEIAILAAKVIGQETSYTMDESEIGYLTLHFSLAIERVQQKINCKKNLIIVCASGAGTSQILLYKIKQRFSNYLGHVKVCELYELNNINQREFDLILTTVPIPFITQIPNIQVQYFLTGKDLISISEAFKEASNDMSFVNEYFHESLFFKNLKGKNRNEIIHEICRKTNIVKKLPVGFEESVIEREDFAATEFGNSVVIPHPMKPCTDETFVSVGILEKGIHWNKQYVKFVFLLCIKKETKESLGLFNEVLSSLILDKKSMLQFERTPSICCLKNILFKLANTEKENDIDKMF